MTYEDQPCGAIVHRMVGFGFKPGAASLVARWPAALLGFVCLGVVLAMSTGWNLAATRTDKDARGDESHVHPNEDLIRPRRPVIGGSAQPPGVGAVEFDDGERQVKPEPIDEEAVRLRGVGQKLFPLADYESMAATYAELCARPSATIDDHMWHGHASRTRCNVRPAASR